MRVGLREAMQQVLNGIRERRSALSRAWESGTLDRIAKEFSRDFDFDEELVRALIRNEIGEQGRTQLTTLSAARTLSDLEMKQALLKAQ